MKRQYYMEKPHSLLEALFPHVILKITWISIKDQRSPSLFNVICQVRGQVSAHPYTAKIKDREPG